MLILFYQIRVFLFKSCVFEIFEGSELLQQIIENQEEVVKKQVELTQKQDIQEKEIDRLKKIVRELKETKHAPRYYSIPPEIAYDDKQSSNTNSHKSRASYADILPYLPLRSPEDFCTFEAILWKSDKDRMQFVSFIERFHKDKVSSSILHTMRAVLDEQFAITLRVSTIIPGLIPSIKFKMTRFATTIIGKRK